MEERRTIIAARTPETVRKNDRKRYYRDKEQRRAAMDAYHKAHPEEVAANKRAWAKRNPEKRRAQVKLRNAVRSGRIARSDTCARADEGGCSGRIEGHHEDYSKPLEVVWLCVSHHAETRRIAA